MKIRYFALVAVAVSMMSACEQPPSAEEVCGSDIFDFGSRLEPLGSGSRLKEEIGKAAAAKAATTLGDIARDAGWSDNWDRMITVYADPDIDELNKAAQIDRPEPCWRGLPYHVNSDGPSDGYYLFLSNRKRVQSVGWDTVVHPPLSLRRHPALTPQSALVVDKDGKLVPAS
ncbi:hypothetical protein OG874_03640 [Nocardia sp. NBC_00565]|uniref:hypothetical protein n=1 Tax=Nocardia sp. NBC_00565 TaxID=2975993 RepID=UPI002E80E974|nr:hypothetical protein [Nocardia sp. NBC_00565]WUC04311.1 hypothetical protein OG874_03640 [Nocardia sp. NBC_00565]